MRDADPLFTVMEECKKEQSHADPFIRAVKAPPEPMGVLARDCQLEDMASFCIDDQQFFALGADPAFNLGEFSVTVTTYCHLQLIHHETNKHPVLHGPMIVHQNKTFESYYFLASTVVGLCPQLNFLTAFGTDGEQTLGDAFTTQFRNASHLLCILHVKDRIKVKLHDLGVNTKCAKFSMNEIFGQ